jgi:protein SCO1
MCRRGLLGLVVLAVGCAAPAPASRHAIRGQLLAVQLDTGQVLLKHDAVPGVMDAMTMPFPVADRRSVLDRRPGDLVTATLVVEAERSYLDGLTLVGTAPLPGEAVAGPVALDVAMMVPGDAAPTVALTSHQGQPVSIAGWRGDAGVVTFIYTRCPLPDFCPMLDRRFAAIQEAVEADGTLRGRVHLLSVSFDPAFDTPEVLRTHAARVGARAGWRFAVAPAPVVDRFATAFGVTVVRETDGTITHNLRTAVIGPDGRLSVAYSGSDWTPDQILADLRRALDLPSGP